MNLSRLSSVLALVAMLAAPVLTYAQQVVLGTKNNAWFAGKSLLAHELVLYDMQTGAVRTIFLGNPGENFDAASFLPDGDLAFSGRTNLVVDQTTFNPKHVGRYDWLGDSASLLISDAPNDIAAVHIINSYQFLLAFKVATQFGGLDYEVGDVFLYNAQTDTATLAFSHDEFFTVGEGGSYAVGNIDALAQTASGNLLLSTTNTAEIGDDSASAVKLFQSGVYEIDAQTGAVSEFFDSTLIIGSGVDIKAFSLVPSPIPDIDGDGVADWHDDCQTTPAGASVNNDGCALFELDSDEDGVTDDVDQCPTTPPGEAADDDGCAWSELDDDDDGVLNGRDYCLDSLPGEPVNVIGCPKQRYGIPLLPVFGNILLLVALLAVFSVVRGQARKHS